VPDRLTRIYQPLFSARASLSFAYQVAARKSLIAPEGRLTMHLSGLNSICAENGASGYAVTGSLTVADLAIWRLAGWLSSGVIDGIPVDYVASSFPAIAEVCEMVDAHPKVIEWKAQHQKLYPAA
jgi:glutathione S-transferase